MPSTKTKTKQFKPYGRHRIWVEPISGETNTGKIIMPDTATSRDLVPIKGRVIDVSPDCQDVKPGDYILFEAHRGKPVYVNHRDMISIPEDNVFAVMNGTKVKDVRAIANVVFIEWEFCTNTFDGTSILRPETHTERQYTGIVLSKGLDVKEVKLKDRVFFERFALSGKLYEGQKRYAFLPEEFIEAVIFKRAPFEFEVK